MLVKELQQGLYSPLPYYIAVSMANFLWNWVMIMLIGIPIFFINGNNFEHYYNFLYWVLIITVSMIIGEAWGVMISVISPKRERAMIIFQMSMQPFLMCCGFFKSDTSIPYWLTPFRFLSFYRYIFLSMIRNEFHNIKNCDFPEGQPNLCDIVDRLNATAPTYQNILIILAIAVFVKILGYIIFKKQMGKWMK